MAEANYITLEINNLGPFKNRVKLEENKVGPLHTTIYARNGSGKSFIGRAFWQIEHFQQGEPFKYLDELPTFGTTDMSFSFSCYRKHEDTPYDCNNFFFAYHKGDERPKFNLNSNWKIHVFNQDFIEQNISQETHTLNSNIPGDIIVGEENVKINQLEQENQKLIEKEDIALLKIKTIIDVEKARLNSKKEFSRLNEFKTIDLNRVLAKPTIALDFEQEQNNWQRLRDLKEDLPELKIPLIDIDENLIISISTNLHQTIKRTEIDADIKEKIIAHSSFFEQGTALWEKNPHQCPFCDQPLQSSVLELVKTYVVYFRAEEAKFTRLLESNSLSLKDFIKELHTLGTSLRSLVSEYHQQASYFLTIKEKDLEEFSSFARLRDNLNELYAFLDEKLADKDKTDFDSDSLVSIILDDIHALQQYLININSKISHLESTKRHMNEAKKNARENVCNALVYKLHQQTLNEVEILNNYARSREENQRLIAQLRSKVKLSKNDEVQKLFKDLLREFFGNHYTYDENIGRLKYNGTISLESTKHVISDGEKSVIAFAHYIAMIHKVVDDRNDYNNLFLIIDDPISSMDFNFVYQVCHVIKNLQLFIPNASQGIRFLVLTHNHEFANILSCNNITQTTFCIENGQIKKLSTQMLLPYDAHLRHIYRVSREKEDVSCHTPNSIRHVLETINSFKYPNQRFIDGVFREPFFEKSNLGDLYLLIQDLSHGRWRRNELYSTEHLKQLTKLVMKYIEENFVGQFKFIKTQEENQN